MKETFEQTAKDLGGQARVDIEKAILDLRLRTMH